MHRRTQGPTHFVIPDTQCKPGVPLDHLEWAGRYVSDKRPDVIVHLDDHYDMPSLSSYDTGKKAMEGRRYLDDIAAGDRGLKLFEDAVKKHAPRGYKPRRVVTLGNHTNRITRAIESDPKLDGKLSLDDLAWGRYSWKVFPFLQPVSIDSVLYAHYFPLSANGAVMNASKGAPSASAQVKRVMSSCVSGHRQGFDYAEVQTPKGIKIGIIAGSFYQHSEAYMSPQGDQYWRGCLALHDVDTRTGSFDVCKISLSWLRRRYG